MKDERDSLNYPIRTDGDPEPKEPVRKRLIFNDVTIEAAGIVLAGNPGGVSLVRDEMDAAIRDFEKPGHESDRKFWIEMWDGDKHASTNDRVGRGFTAFCKGGGMFGNYQPEIWLRILRDEVAKGTDGWAARAQAIVYPNEKKHVRTDIPVDAIARKAYRRIIETLAELPPMYLTMRFTRESQAFFNSWLDDLDGRIYDEPHAMKKSHISKYARLLLVCAGNAQIIDFISSHPEHMTYIEIAKSFPKILPIELKNLENAVQVANYLETHADRLYGLAARPEQAAALILKRRILDGKLADGFTAYEIVEKGWGGLDKYNVQGGLDFLESKNWVRSKKVVVNRKSKVIYEINPKVQELRKAAEAQKIRENLGGI